MSQTDTLGLILGFAGVCVVNATAVAVVWIQGKTRADRTDYKIDEVGAGQVVAAAKADLVAKRVEPVSNGFAASVLESLRVLKQGQVDLSEEVHQFRQKMDRHIDDHDSADARRTRRWRR